MRSDRARSIACLGGSFDPVHLGHLELMRVAREQLGVDILYAVPAHLSPLKGPARFSDEDRLTMLQLALQECPGVSILDWELRRQGISYTIDTIDYLERLHPGARFWWIIGSDQLANLERWHRIEELVQKVNFAVYHRPKFPAQIPNWRGFQGVWLKGAPLQISSTEIRARLDDGNFLEKVLPKTVARHIRERYLKSAMNKKSSSDIMPVLQRCYRALADKKAIDIQVIDISKISSITDFMIVASATSEPHLRALRIALEEALEGHIDRVAMDYAPTSGWLVVDGFDVMIHLFTQDRRAYYGLESLWKDGKSVTFNEKTPVQSAS